jgi:hypothetical protein
MSSSGLHVADDDYRYEASRPKASEEDSEEDVTKVPQAAIKNVGIADDRYITPPEPIPNSANLLPSYSKPPSPTHQMVVSQYRSSHSVVVNNCVSTRK